MILAIVARKSDTDRTYANNSLIPGFLSGSNGSNENFSRETWFLRKF